MINMFEAVDELPKDLKVKLYNLNNLDLIGKDKNKKFLDLLEGNINEFIQKSKDEILSFFIENIDRRIVKENNFIQKVLDIILSRLNDMRDNNEISNYYTNLLKDSFKSKFITSYTNIMNDELEELIELINDQKEQLKVEIDYCFTLDPEDVLNDINNKLNYYFRFIK